MKTEVVTKQDGYKLSGEDLLTLSKFTWSLLGADEEPHAESETQDEVITEQNQQFSYIDSTKKFNFLTVATQNVLAEVDDKNAFNTWSEAWNDEDSSTILVKDSERNSVIGYAMVNPLSVMGSERIALLPSDIKPAKVAYMYSIFVDETYRGQGVATILHKTIFNRLLQLGYQYLELDAKEKDGYSDLILSKFTGAVEKVMIDGIETHNLYGLGQQYRFRIDVLKALSLMS